MMISFDALFIFLLLAANAMLLGLTCHALVRFERRCQRIEDFWESPTGNALAETPDTELREQMQATQRLERRVGELQRTVKVIELNKQRPQPAEPTRPTAERNLPIENAIRMARLGASVEDLTRSCGLNFGEARLMQKLHRRAAKSGAGI
ncbi:MAG: DUF2802 domain-containing protein [Woeseiaceae bacterium]|nr:DUF2802 domain-containing protein [Woeseiaceae bacterium]